MSRKIKSKNKISRRYGVNIFSTSPKKLRLSVLPGGLTSKKSSIYKTQLYAKQVLNYYYFGLGNKKLKEAYKITKTSDNPAQELIVYMEGFLSSFLRALGYCKSILEINQRINHGHIKVNGTKMPFKKYRLKVNDVVEVKSTKEGLKPKSYVELNNNGFKYIKPISYENITIPIAVNSQKCIDFYNR